jgi:hypothetical protein
MRRYLTPLVAAVAAITISAPLTLHGSSDASARSFRQDDRIVRPPTARPGTTARPPAAAAPVVPVNPMLVRKAVFQIAAAWNGHGLGKYLERSQFYDKRRLLDVISRDVPRNAKMRILTVGGVNTLSQRVEKRREGIYLISVVTASVSLQVEFNNPQTGFQRLQGRNEWTLQVVEKKGR